MTHYSKIFKNNQADMNKNIIAPFEQRVMIIK